MLPFSKTTLTRALLAAFLAVSASGAYAGFVLRVPMSATASAPPDTTVAPPTVPAAATTETISVSPGGWYAGDVAPGSEVTRTFTVTNISGAPIVELGVWSDGGARGFVIVPEQTTCVSYPNPQEMGTFDSGSLPTGGSCEVTVRFTSTGVVQEDTISFDAANIAGEFTGRLPLWLTGNADNLGSLFLEPIGWLYDESAPWGVDPTDGASSIIGEGCMYRDDGRFWFGQAETLGFGLCAGAVLTNGSDTPVTGISLTAGFQMQLPVALAPPATFIMRTTTEDSALNMANSLLTPHAGSWDCPATGTFTLGPWESCLVLHVVKPAYEANGVGAISAYSITAAGGIRAIYRWRGFEYEH